mmetsp:Transcript_1900/g.3910  ORF Transcript_1900/g.3910 Transcript_1900/m.3910 type:complete len:1012 (-) Transcript_1900:1136-4171(-)
MKRKTAEEPQPDLEAHFSDGAWYDVVLSAADPSRDRFLVQARDFPDEQEWVESSVIRPQSQPFEKPPSVGSTVLALHRSQRSDLFFEGVVKDLCNGSHCRIQFTEGRVRGQHCKVPLDDVNRICSRKLSPHLLRSWCTSQKPVRTPANIEVVEFKKGEFVLIEGPDEGFWVAQLMEPYTGRISEEVDDVDDDGPTVKLRWLYKPNELPKHILKGQEIDKKHEVFVSFHRDTIDARLIVQKCKVSFAIDRPRKDHVFQKDELFSCRTWDPIKRKTTPMDCPLLPQEFKAEIRDLLAHYPLKKARGFERRRSAEEKATNSPETGRGSESDQGGDSTQRWKDEEAKRVIKEEEKQPACTADGSDQPSDAELTGGKADSLESSDGKMAPAKNGNGDANKNDLFVGIAEGVKRERMSKSPPTLVAHLSGETSNRRRPGSKSPDQICAHTKDVNECGSPEAFIQGEDADKAGSRNGSPDGFQAPSNRRSGSREKLKGRSKSPMIGSLSGSKRSSQSPADEERAGSKTPCNSGLIASRSPTEPLNRDIDGKDLVKVGEEDPATTESPSPAVDGPSAALDRPSSAGTGTNEADQHEKLEMKAEAEVAEVEVSEAMADLDVADVRAENRRDGGGEQGQGVDVAQLQSEQSEEEDTAGDTTDFSTTTKVTTEVVDTKCVQNEEVRSGRLQDTPADFMHRRTGIHTGSEAAGDSQVAEQPEHVMGQVDVETSPETEGAAYTRKGGGNLEVSGAEVSGAEVPSAEVQGAEDAQDRLAVGSGVVLSAVAVLLDDDAEDAQVAEPEEEVAEPEGEYGSADGSPDSASADLSHDNSSFVGITTLSFVEDGVKEDDERELCSVYCDDHSDEHHSARKYANCSLTTDFEAVEGFIIEAVRHACTSFLKQQQFTSVVYFLHRGKTWRELSCVGISACFKSARAYKQCQKFLRSYARDKNAFAAILVAEDHKVKYPRWTQRSVGKHQHGLYMQLDSTHRRGVWHIIPGTESDCSFTKLDVEHKWIIPRIV